MPSPKSSHVLTARLKQLIPYYLLFLAVWIFYSNTYGNGFLYDDEYLIQTNAYLHNRHALGAIFTTYVNSGAGRFGNFYRPLQNLLYFAVYQIGGPSPFGFHILNIALHAINACLVYALGRKLNFKPGAVFLAALLWALHPLHTEAVTYMSATADPLYALFCLSGVIVVLPDFAPRKCLIAAPLFICGLLSKETAIILPLLAMSCIYLRRRETPGVSAALYLRTWPLWLVAAIYMIIRFWIMPFDARSLLNIDPTSQAYAAHITLRIYTFLATLPHYFALLVWPAGLHMDRDFPVYLDPWGWPVVTGALMLGFAAAQAAFARGRMRPLGWGLAWFAAAHLPHTGVLVPVNSLFLEHWMYLPSAGLMLGAAETLARYAESRQMRFASGSLAALIALALGWRTYEQNKIWHDPFVFYANIISHGEKSVRARNNLGIAFMREGDYNDAMMAFRSALRDTDLTPETHQNIAAALTKAPDGRPHIKEEIAELNRALAIKPDFLPALNSLADIYNYLGDKAKAASYRQKADAVTRKTAP